MPRSVTQGASIFSDSERGLYAPGSSAFGIVLAEQNTAVAANKASRRQIDEGFIV